MQNKVTQIKEQLENFLSESNRILKIREKITKGIKALEREKEKNMIKVLSYVSKINSSDISIYQNFLEKESKTNFPEQYSDSTGKGKSIFTGNSDKGKSSFKIEEVEVYKLSQ